MVRGHLRIRPVETEDLTAVDALIELGFRSGSRPLARADALPAGEIRYVAADGDELIGFGAARSYGVAAYVGPLVVHPDARRRGVASELLRTLVRSLDAMGTRTLLLDATEENAPLYERFGFAAIDATDVYERRVEPAVEPAPHRLMTPPSRVRSRSIDRSPVAIARRRWHLSRAKRPRGSRFARVATC